jgi:hypothetical protein
LDSASDRPRFNPQKLSQEKISEKIVKNAEKPRNPLFGSDPMDLASQVYGVEVNGESQAQHFQLKPYNFHRIFSWRHDQSHGQSQSKRLFNGYAFRGTVFARIAL